MGQMFKHRPSKLLRRKEFESRVWKTSERFTYYYHDKVIFGNQVPVEEEEIIDYIVDGISDRQLLDQIRMLRFCSGTDLPEVFENNALNCNKTSGSNLNKTALGYLATECIKSKRYFGAFYLWRNVTSRSVLNMVVRRRKAKEVKNVIVIRGRNHNLQHQPYLFPISYEVTGKVDHTCEYTLSAMIQYHLLA
ncbi:hypothetical protein GWI33_021022 [Rhynchophorus ferrugineus]|uniref:Uncharacterized protein n=1 Tax=Rhynchophorus ferrugineus TaxID=354439 RepID=A0A834HPR1_RHYFE|nr:hypothetical protein GWI33_021022 [Rhynchophorus ferrugineus]